MLPYQAMAMDYAVTSSFQRHPGNAVNMNMNMNMNPAFTHSWFMPADLCVPFKPSQPLLEPGILELRKEKSRDAARSRRGKENFEFYELAKMLPLPAAITSQLDKASIIRLTISYLKLRDFSGHGDPPWNRDTPPLSKNLKTNPLRSRSPINIALENFEQYQGTHILQSLDGFAFALAADGRFLYISETVSIYLGLSQCEMTGSSLFDYIHHGDHSEVAEQLGLGLSQGQSIASPSSANSEEGASNTGTANPDVSSVMSLSSTSAYRGLDRSFCVRMKSTLTKRGCHFKSSGYRVVLLLCRLRPQLPFSHSRKSSPPLLGAVSLAIALPPPSVHEIRLESDMFVMRVNFDFRIAHCEPKVAELLDYTADEITGMNLYTLCHGEDVQRLRKCHLDLINKGQMISHYYRVMNKNGGYTWVQTIATVVCSSKNAEEQNIICVNYVMSRKEYENVVMDCCQLEENLVHRAVKREDIGGGNDPENGSPDTDPTGEGSHGNTAAERHRDHRLSPAELEDGSSEGGGGGSGGGGGVDDGGRGHVDHVTHLHNTVPSTTTTTTTGTTSMTMTTTTTTTTTTATATATAVNDVSHSQMNNILHPLPAKDLAAEKALPVLRRLPHKRKLSTPLHREEGSSCDSSDEGDSLTRPRLRSKRSTLTTASKTMTSTMTSSTTTTTATTTATTAEEAALSASMTATTASLPGSVASSTCRSRRRYPVLSPASSCNSSAGHAVSASPQTVPHDDSDGGGMSNSTSAGAVVAGGSASVKDLENAMSKHLPAAGMVDKNGLAAGPPLHQPTDFSTDTLLKQQQQRSTIQWIGAHHHHLNQLSHHQHAQHYGSPLPASALLKQLYAANRESVIRANVHAAATGQPSRNGSSPGISPYYTGEVNHVGPLPTPPGSEGSFSEQFGMPHGQKSTVEPFTSLYAGGGTYSVDYHAAAMTPPSSVSPRDKHQHQHQQQQQHHHQHQQQHHQHQQQQQQPQIHQHANGGTAFDSSSSSSGSSSGGGGSSAYNDVLRHQYLSGGSAADLPTQPLPLKPQAYTPMHHGALDAYASAASTLDQSQFYHSAASFHIYHPVNKAASAHAVSHSPANWYPTPS